MVAFHDRRKTAVGSVDELVDRLPLSPGDTVGKHIINDRYVVVGHQTEHGRQFVTYEALPNGRVVPRGEGEDRRYKANSTASALQPTSTYDV